VLPKAIIIGGTGQIGLTTARLLDAENWDVTLVSRTSNKLAGVRHVVADASDAAKLKTIVGTDTDLLVSCIAFDAADADCLAMAGRNAQRIVAVSSASVYCDDEGRTLDEASENGFPDFQKVLAENSTTVAPGPDTYSTRKVAMERRLVEASSSQVTILRPCAIHGPESKYAREWWFVKRLLDGRKAIPLAYAGRSRFQTTSVAAIADGHHASHGQAI
jgi:nucleoside-diphosphate-sugar epimerase